MGAIEDGRASDNYVITLNATEGLAELYSVMGQLRKAEETFLQVFQLGDQYRMTYSVAFGAAHIGLAEVMRQWSKLDTAVEHLQQGFDLINFQECVHGYNMHFVKVTGLHLGIAGGEDVEKKHTVDFHKMGEKLVFLILLTFAQKGNQLPLTLPQVSGWLQTGEKTGN